MKTLNNFLQILPDKPATKTAGGIVLPDVAQDVPKSGVVQLGDPEFVGKRVYYPSFAPQKVTLGNIEYHFVKIEDCILVTDGN